MANPFVFWLLTAFTISAMCLSWTIVADILLYAIYPTKRSFASAINILVVHLFGDAGSPYIIGMVYYLDFKFYLYLNREININFILD
jgi:hypothetical protein